MNDAAERVKITKSMEDADAIAVFEKRSTYPLINSFGSLKKAATPPLVMYAEIIAAAIPQLNNLFSRTFAVNHPRSDFVTDVTGFLVAAYGPRIPYPPSAAPAMKGLL